MKRILLFGSTGHVGKEIAKEAIKQGFDLAAVVRNEKKAAELSSITKNCLIADVTDKKTLTNICDSFDIIISALGKSVSPNDKSKPSFIDIDLNANSNILEEAVKSKVEKFVYISALHSERYPSLIYFKVHHEFSERLKASGIDYSIIKPPAIFSAFIDLAMMAKKGQLITIGKGNMKTNPIHEADVAIAAANSIQRSNATIEIGGPKTYSRKELNEIIQQHVNPNKKVRTVPLGLMKMMLPMFKLFNRNSYDKFAFFTEVIQHDTIGPQIGIQTFEEYLKLKLPR